MDYGLRTAIEAVGGRKTELVRRINEITDRRLSHSALSQWTRVPLDRVSDVAKVTGVPKHILRPDQHDPPQVVTALRGAPVWG